VGDQTRRVPLEKLIALSNRVVKPSVDPARAEPASPLAWVYNGALVSGGEFVGERSGSIIALIFDPAAMINNPGADRADDEVHFPASSQLPEPGSAVKVVLSDYLSPTRVDSAAGS